MTTVKTLLAALMIACFGACAVHAETKADEPKPAPAQVQPGVLTEAKLKEMLEMLGYQPREEKAGAATLYWITVKADGLNYEVSFQISPNKEKIWTIIPLADINDEHKKLANRWVKLTELNDAIGPCYFRYNEKNKRLYMSRAMDNRGVTTALLRGHLERATDRCAETKEHWMSTTWAVKTQNVSEAPKQ